MSSQAQGSDAALGGALLQAIEQGSFPQDEHVASANVPPSALPKLREGIEAAREGTKDEVRKLSREAASDVDGWITQARKLQADIQRSQEMAKDIVEQAKGGNERTARVQDSASKVSLLHSEIAYSRSLAHVVQQLKDIWALLDAAQSATARGHIMHALHTIDDAVAACKRLGPFATTRVARVLKNKEEQLRKVIVETVTESWNELVCIDNTHLSISLKQSIEQDATVDIITVVDALTKLSLLDASVVRLGHDLDKIIVSPRLTTATDQVVAAFVIHGDRIQRDGCVQDSSIKAALQDIQGLAEYLHTHLPPCIALPLSAKLLPIIASRLVSNLLLPAVPLSTHEIPAFQETLSYVLGLAEYFDELGWSGQHHLTTWVDKSAEIWLARQKETAIARVQTLFPKHVQEKKIVEKVETQLIFKGDALHTDQDEDWGDNWGDDEELAQTRKDVTTQFEEEDLSAWGEEENEADENMVRGVAVTDPSTSDGDADDWGAEWGDEEEDTKPPTPRKHTTDATDQLRRDKKPLSHKPPAEREVTLREAYTVTAIPDSIMEIILQVIESVKTLNSPDLVTSAIAPASVGLYAIPSLLLAMYRATAVMHYSKDTASNMLIYNDCQRLSDRLRSLLQDQTVDDPLSTMPNHVQPLHRLKPRLESDIQTIDGFGKRAYGREMESQRQIIRDHLEDAQGFQGCTNVPFSIVCDNAIATTIDRIGVVKYQWQNVLSHSALLQSLGSLVSAVLTKFVNDVEDMSDIAEDESRKLHGYCISLATLSQHFETKDPGGESRDTTSIYTPNWFKFQYLGEILDSSLADIKYFWTDGELRLEMEAEEVVGLIEALFAPSDHRRRAIADIRRTV